MGKIRNPLISQTLFYYGYIDAFGTGFDRTFTVCANNGVEYKYNNDELGFTFSFKRKQNFLNDKINDLIFGSYKKKKPPKLSCLSRNRRLFFRIFFSTFNGFYCMRLYFLHLANLRTDDPSL